jgi:hypothetical protein
LTGLNCFKDSNKTEEGISSGGEGDVFVTPSNLHSAVMVIVGADAHAPEY